MIHTISNGKLTAKIDSLGSQLISMTDQNGLEYIWQRETPYWQQCAPIPFPVVGRCKDGIITVDGQDYPMPDCHGFAQNMDFETAELTDSSVTLRIRDNEETRKAYPFAFLFEVTHKIENDTLSTVLRVVNRSDREMPFGVGGHPGYRLPLLPDEKFTDYELDFGKPLTLDTSCVDENFMISSTLARRVVTDARTLSLDRNLFAADALIFENPPFDSVILRSKKSGLGIHFGFKGFSTFAVWTEAAPSEAAFLCLEPWNGMGVRSGEGTELAKKKGTLFLAPQQEFVCTYSAAPLTK